MECPICLQKIKYKIKTKCKHTFCDICIVKQLMIKNICPICRRVCDYEYITDRISIKRQKFLMKKLITPVEINHIDTNTMRDRDRDIQPIQRQSMTIYSRFIPQYVPTSSMVISLFIINSFIIIYIVIVISQAVESML
jgi:hypothetical protein